MPPGQGRQLTQETGVAGSRSADNSVLVHVQNVELAVAVLEVKLDSGPRGGGAVAHLGVGCNAGPSGRSIRGRIRLANTGLDGLRSGVPRDSTSPSIVRLASPLIDIDRQLDGRVQRVQHGRHRAVVHEEVRRPRGRRLAVKDLAQCPLAAPGPPARR